MSADDDALLARRVDKIVAITDPETVEPTQAALLAFVITHADGYSSRVAHAIVTSSGAAPGPGVGWHTACAKTASSVDKWAAPAQTGPDGYGFRAPEQEQPCTRCFPQGVSDV